MGRIHSNKYAIGCCVTAVVLMTAYSSHADDLDSFFTSLDTAEDVEEAPVDFVPIDDDYKSGRGLITMQGMSGMFQNPTSGTLNQGQLTTQYCVALYNNDGPNNTVHGLMVAYGLTDAIEIGGVYQHFDVNSRSTDFQLAAPFVRVRLLKDEGMLPELSIGFIHLDGDAADDIVARTELFLAMSKRFELDEEGFFKAVRPHLGVRQIWRPEYPKGIVPTINAIPGYDPDANATVGFAGIELEMVHDLSFVAEVSTKDDYAEHLPWSAGMQWKPNNVLGLSLGLVEGPGEDHVSVYIGVGLNFNF